jgi:outer membrane protein assembly factor BamD (BamD/ComL family)
MFALGHTGQIVRAIILCLISVLIVVWVGFRSLKRSEDPPQLIFKWILTAGIILILATKVAPMVAAGGMGAAFGGIPFAAVCGLALAVIWRKSIAGIISKPFGDLYDGGDVQIEPHPVYSSAQAKRKRGFYPEAMAEIRQQLEQFPGDFDGQIMLAEIQAENMNDLPGAELTITRLGQQTGHPPRSIAFAYNLLADWQLKLCQDREAARQALERIIAQFPDSEMSALASQRIAHLASAEHLLAYHDPKPIVVKPGVENLGLQLAGAPQLHAPEIAPATQAAEYVRHLVEHPLDTEAREKLAILYADHYGRLDLAADQMEQLIAHPNQPAKRVVHWLNLLADLQIRHGADYEAARQTLQRIVDLFPNSAAGENARSRLSVLKLELKGKEKGQTVTLGQYEQDIGLKGGLPRQF